MYGHTRAGYTVPQLSDALRKSGLEPKDTGGYSRFMTEMIELAINFGYVRVLAKRHGGAKNRVTLRLFLPVNLRSMAWLIECIRSFFPIARV